MMPSGHADAYANGNFALHPSAHSQSTLNAPAAMETVHLYVPNAVIGAIIGSKGLFIKSIIKNSNASVKVIDRLRSAVANVHCLSLSRFRSVK